MTTKQERLKEVYNHLRSYFGIHTQIDFAEAIRITRPALSSAMNRNEAYLTNNLFQKICAAFPGVFDLNYLLTGEGSLLTVEEEVKSELIEKESNQNNAPISVSIPSGYIGTTGLAVSFFTISAPEEWTTDVAVAIKDGNGTAMGSATIDDAPMKDNRSAEYSGNMFSGSNTMTVALNATCDSPVICNF